jgi:hypothetical protein
MNTLNSVFRVVIAYDNLVAGIEAADVLRRVALQLEEEFGIQDDVWQIDSGVWKFETLRDPELRAEAAGEAVAADIIIISVGSAELPASVENWIESVLLRKEGGQAAMVALLDPRHEISGEPPRLENYFRRLAEQYGLDLFCNTDEPRLSVRSGIASALSRNEDDPVLVNDATPRDFGQREMQSELPGREKLVHRPN